MAFRRPADRGTGFRAGGERLLRDLRRDHGRRRRTCNRRTRAGSRARPGTGAAFCGACGCRAFAAAAGGSTGRGRCRWFRRGRSPTATLKTKINADIPAQVILGACRPPLAHAALQAEPSIGLLLPCNVVVRSLNATTTLVEAIDPDVMATLTQNQDLPVVVADARSRLTAALTSLTD